jgi:hypothetical protein
VHQSVATTYHHHDKELTRPVVCKVLLGYLEENSMIRKQERFWFDFGRPERDAELSRVSHSVCGVSWKAGRGPHEGEVRSKLSGKLSL